MTDNTKLIAVARERQTVTRLGKSSWRETDKDLVALSRVTDALEAAEQRITELEALSVRWQTVIMADGFEEAVERHVVQFLRERRAVDADRDALVAVIEQAKATLIKYPSTGRDRTINLLASADTAAAFREVRAQAWWEGVEAQWKHRPLGNRVSELENQYTAVSGREDQR